MMLLQTRILMLLSLASLSYAEAPIISDCACGSKSTRRWDNGVTRATCDSQSLPSPLWAGQTFALNGPDKNGVIKCRITGTHYNMWMDFEKACSATSGSMTGECHYASVP
ncbi:hypothetical protein Cob_v009618 [Colletotrichum orbiculare MAFF 240422]|uniref:Cyanovirin-N domain-containing protein n=1 Tax=Colletotrichum orbiculare (strain 104-T / ATCC 96160 / CBS 514.97 / LARS 414 / MAFF 240422) TaxID=1213857 RepID=A0A484FIY5_COLOR|nr:hypothetical protein Cob_v009618 [Colletotrichum orbiculare MAFF 240422]